MVEVRDTFVPSPMTTPNNIMSIVAIDQLFLQSLLAFGHNCSLLN